MPSILSVRDQIACVTAQHSTVDDQLIKKFEQPTWLEATNRSNSRDMLCSGVCCCTVCSYVLTVHGLKKLGAGEVRDEPAGLVDAVDDVGPLPPGVRLVDGGAVLHVDVAEAEPDAVLGQLDVAPHGRARRAGGRPEGVGALAGVRERS
jgi:hypothetical protein